MTDLNLTASEFVRKAVICNVRVLSAPTPTPALGHSMGGGCIQQWVGSKSDYQVAAAYLLFI